MPSLRQGVASAVGADVRIALQKMSANYVRNALSEEMDSSSAAAAAHDALSLQDALYGLSAADKKPSRNPKRSAEASTTSPTEAPATDTSTAQVRPEGKAQKPSRRSGKSPSTSSKSSPGTRQPASKNPFTPAPSVQVRRDRTVAAPPALRRSPTSASRPTAATARKMPAPRMLDEELLPGTAGLPLMLRRRPSLVLKEARGKSAPAREKMISATRTALSALHKGAYPTMVARPAGDRAHEIIKGIERMQFTSPALKKAPSSKGRKAKRKLNGGVPMAAASLRPEVRARLEKSEREAAATARSRSIDAASRLPVSSHQAMYRGYGVPVSGGLPSLGRRN